MSKHFVTVLLIIFINTLRAQDIYMNDPDFDQNNPMDCSLYGNGGTVNFYDPAGTGGNYANNYMDTLVICPDLTNGIKTFISFGTNIGFVFDIDGSDSMYVFDGPNTSSPLLGAHNSVTDPNGFNYMASFENNPSGCLTLVFHSDASINGAGWAANVACGNPPQPFNPHMKAFKNGNSFDSLSPIDTGKINICLGDSVLYVGAADFPYSLENTGIGYSQNNSSVSYKWFFSNGLVLNGDSVWFTPPGRAGYVVTLQVTDSFPNTEQIFSFVRVNPRVDFRHTRALNDSICEGDSVILIAGLTNNDTVGASPVVAITEVGGAYAGLTYLPDGSGINYETTIEISGFGSGQTLTTGMDVMKLVITMEHSFLGDLEMMLSCPTGDSMIIFNAYPGQGIGPMFAGGFGGGGTFLGDADDGFNGNPGIGWTYTFSDTLADWGTMGQEWAAGNTLSTTISSGQGMNPDSIYLPEMSFDAMIGCPINGTWTLTIRDNQGIDDGYIFDWAIYFNPYINPNFQSYTSTIVDAKWRNGLGTVLGGTGDTIISDIPDSTGFSYYNFQVLDDFGCLQDTTITVFETARPSPITLDTGTCLDHVILSVNGADSALWRLYTGIDSLITFLPDSTDTAVTIYSLGAGFYQFELNGYVNNCIFQDSITVEFYPLIPAKVLLSDTTACLDSYVINPKTDASNASYAWLPGGATSDSLTITKSGTYYVTVTGCGTSIDSVHIELMKMPDVMCEILSCDSLLSVKLDHMNLGGSWLVMHSDITNYNFDTSYTSKTFSLHTAERGYITVGYYDSLCSRVDSVNILFEHNPTVAIWDSVICAKDLPLVLHATFSPKSTVSYLWSDGSRDSILKVFSPGVYELTVGNDCGTAQDSVHVKIRNCDYMLPNVITPNADNLNDVFYVLNAEFYQEIDMKIYNRWGQKVYEGSGKLASWDGSLDGKIVPNGTYYYDVTIDGERVQGAFSVITE